MAVVQTAGAPPNQGSRVFPISGSTMKSRKAERVIEKMK
jgi:hypothetical protein